ncbi:DUF881 domain-containing protein [Actinacidiphila yeochonensis]|uniref:DUF881 domain-containing protein n=1 Tax=Actinacidiphila yeochonensis TaxID=89050 RepID=UPI00099CDF0C|nr:DUF881 domain-containing protein [Actinacidiphila yeochonensis]
MSHPYEEPPEVRPGQRTEGPPREPSATAGEGSRTGPAAPPAGDGAAQLTGGQRLVAGLWPPRLSRAQVTAAGLLFVLGLGLAVQVRTTSESGDALRGARQDDLVRILTELDNRDQRLQDEKHGLESQRADLESSSDRAAEALRQTRQKARELGVLAGTVAAQGPGITVTITDPHGGVEADSLLDTVQELRAAGAEAIQIDGVRVVAGTCFTDGSGGVLVDGREAVRPYVLKVIGNPPDLEPALNIPGGVVQSLEKEQVGVDVVRSQKIVVDALRSEKQPDYARSSR